MISQRKKEELDFVARLTQFGNDIEERQRELNKIFGQDEDPKDKRIRELEAENERLSTENADLKRELQAIQYVVKKWNSRCFSIGDEGRALDYVARA